MSRAELLHAQLELVFRYVLDMRRDVPAVPERIEQGAAAIAVKLVLDRPLLLRAGANGLSECIVDVVDVDVQADAGAAQRLG